MAVTYNTYRFDYLHNLRNKGRIYIVVNIKSFSTSAILPTRLQSSSNGNLNNLQTGKDKRLGSVHSTT
jgi:hypothetical protein